MDTEELVWSAPVPRLERPIMIAAFEGWNDAGEAATTAVRHLSDQWMADTVADIDPERFFDFSSTRPQVRLIDGMTREILWPQTRFSVATAQAAGRDVVLLVGNEPQLRWKTFCALIIEAARQLQVTSVLTLGALLADVPHTRPVQITGTATDQALIERFQLQRSRYEGPTGIVGVLHDALSKAGIPSASLWAAVPHYLPGTPSPKAALALVQRATEMMALTISTTSLEIGTAHYERSVDAVVEADEDMVGYVARLEMSHDSGDDEDDDDDDDLVDEVPLVDDPKALPSGDEIAAELEQFLRDQGPA